MWLCGIPPRPFRAPESRERPCRLAAALHTFTPAPRYGRWLICGDIQGQKKVKHEPLRPAGLNLIHRVLALLVKAAAMGLPVDRYEHLHVCEWPTNKAHACTQCRAPRHPWTILWLSIRTGHRNHPFLSNMVWILLCLERKFPTQKYIPTARKEATSSPT